MTYGPQASRVLTEAELWRSERQAIAHRQERLRRRGQRVTVGTLLWLGSAALLCGVVVLVAMVFA